uniref:HTH_48 domain-containing protein n=1 Tax=Glossina pallidipes TaxID=7398 RepID=A0A1A9ZFP5_GLOPL
MYRDVRAEFFLRHAVYGLEPPMFVYYSFTASVSIITQLFQDEICTAYGSGTTTIKTVRNWLKKFRAGSFGLNGTVWTTVAATRQRRIRPSSRRSFICSKMSFIVI